MSGRFGLVCADRTLLSLNAAASTREATAKSAAATKASRRAEAAAATASCTTTRKAAGLSHGWRRKGNLRDRHFFWAGRGNRLSLGEEEPKGKADADYGTNNRENQVVLVLHGKLLRFLTLG